MTEMLPQDVVEEIIRHANVDDGAFLVGGQALSFWAERYGNRAPELARYGPFVSKDIDFFGNRDAAAKLAKALNGTVAYPSLDDHGPNSAIVKAKVHGHEVEIDFLWNVLGPPPAKLAGQVVNIHYPLRAGGLQTFIPIGVMHPLHCLQSRAANVITLGRRNDNALRQLDAAPIVLREYISEALGAGHDVQRARVAASIMKALGAYLLSDPTGTQVHLRTRNNPLDIITAFENDDRFDPRYRDNQLKGLAEEVRARQMRDRKRLAAMAFGQGFSR